MSEHKNPWSAGLYWPSLNGGIAVSSKRSFSRKLNEILTLKSEIEQDWIWTSVTQFQGAFMCSIWSASLTHRFESVGQSELTRRCHVLVERNHGSSKLSKTWMLALCGSIDHAVSYMPRCMASLRINCFLAECVMVIGLQQVLQPHLLCPNVEKYTLL